MKRGGNVYEKVLEEIIKSYWEKVLEGTFTCKDCDGCFRCPYAQGENGTLRSCAVFWRVLGGAGIPDALNELAREGKLDYVEGLGVVAVKES